MSKTITILSLMLLVGAGLAWWALPGWLSQPQQADWSSSSLPAAKTPPTPSQAGSAVAETLTTMEDIPSLSTSLRRSFPQSGDLEFRVRGNRQGQERYTFTRQPDGGLQAFAEGVFNFEIAFVPLELRYRQLLRLNETLAPVQFVSELRGPLGFGNRTTRIDFGPEHAVMVSDGRETIIPLPALDMLAINMFASFALLTQWFEIGQQEAWFMALDAGGFDEDQTPSDGGYRWGSMKLEQMEDLLLQTDDGQINAQRYRMRINGPQDGFQVLFYQGRWIGVWGEATDDGGGHFTVSRTDLFPNGFKVIASNT